MREFGKIPRASSSSAGRPRQVAADRARAGEKFLMAHFPASPSMSRLAGSSGTQKVCEATKSRNRTGSVISKSGRSGLPADARSNDPARSQASVSSRAHRKWPALPPTQRHHVLHSHRKSHERSACAPAPDSEESSFCPDGTVRTIAQTEFRQTAPTTQSSIASSR